MAYCPWIVKAWKQQAQLRHGLVRWDKQHSCSHQKSSSWPLPANATCIAFHIKWGLIVLCCLITLGMAQRGLCQAAHLPFASWECQVLLPELWWSWLSAPLLSSALSVRSRAEDTEGVKEHRGLPVTPAHLVRCWCQSSKRHSEEGTDLLRGCLALSSSPWLPGVCRSTCQLWATWSDSHRCQPSASNSVPWGISQCSSCCAYLSMCADGSLSCSAWAQGQEANLETGASWRPPACWVALSSTTSQVSSFQIQPLCTTRAVQGMQFLAFLAALEWGTGEKKHERGGIGWHAWHQLTQPFVALASPVQFSAVAYKKQTTESLWFSIMYEGNGTSEKN